jgi:hypothetical protein
MMRRALVLRKLPGLPLALQDGAGVLSFDPGDQDVPLASPIVLP